MTREAYNLAKQMVKDLDIPDNAIKEYLPPEQMAGTHFDYIEKGQEFGYSSNEVKLLLLENYNDAEGKKAQSYLDWRNKTAKTEADKLKVPDKPLDSYKL